ncbi:MAG TPA: (5-formylfuran-3-yl)methyl phosphate synthase [Xanthobacteraceae bacterium]|nr:(5-formylfuran-3-yl)methyl phosphate synthase [Xanthobacteraceae bacterium]
MTLFLASVNGPDEAEVALARGADIIDLKDAARGALGALPEATVRATVDAIGRRRPVSTVTGDLTMEPDVITAAVSAMAATGIDFVKVGLFPGERREDCVRALAPLAARMKIVGVMFADDGPDLALLPLLAGSGFTGVMLDTARKGAGGLLERMDIPALGEFVTACRRHGLLTGLAGSLELPDIPRLLLLDPDLLGFRGALCAGQQRTMAIDPDSIRVVRELIPFDRRSAAHDGREVMKVDYRLLAARGYAADAGDDAPADRIFVRDFVAPVRIGAYSRERDRPQRVRFNVDVAVRRSGHTAEDMRDVFSYDVVTDGIRMIVAREHIALLETLAERVAVLVLAHERVIRVTVRAEKLDVGPGGVGVEITRQRPAEVAGVHQLYPAASPHPGPKAAE